MMTSKERPPLYNTWSNMIQRCTNPKNTSYPYYGGRGIKVCERWTNYSDFFDDVYPMWSKGLTLDRIDNDGNYEPGNVRWADHVTQSLNQRIRKDNTSGYPGIQFVKKSQRWLVRYRSMNKGTFATREEAIAYRKSLEST